MKLHANNVQAHGTLLNTCALMDSHRLSHTHTHANIQGSHDFTHAYLHAGKQAYFKHLQIY